ncbi:hypothetical protein [Moorena producens]|uniref:hypothetical protein n=1 Tax=Moorena producens TaxID=1155739 RepID=UPI0011EA70F9|nr:hypothetical protein [Moorena producens]
MAAVVENVSISLSSCTRKKQLKISRDNNHFQYLKNQIVLLLPTPYSLLPIPCLYQLFTSQLKILYHYAG